MEWWWSIVVPAFGIAVAVNFFWFGRRRTGITHGGEPDPRAWDAFATSHKLAFLPLPKRPKMSGSWDGMSVQVEAEWKRVKNDNHVVHAAILEANQSWYVTTKFRVGIGARLPEGLHLRRQSLMDGLSDALISGAELTLGDQAFDDAWLVHGRDAAAIGAVVLDERVRGPLMALHATKGEITVDETSIQMVVPDYIREWRDLERYLSRIKAVVEGLRAVAPRAPEVDLPKYEKGVASRKPTLKGALQRAIAAGFTSTAVGREALAEVPNQNCVVDIDVERIAPYESRTGLQQGVTVVGLLVAGTARVEIHFTGEAVEVARTALPGDRVIADGWVEHFDAMRNLAEVTCDIVPEVRRGTGAAPLAPIARATPAPAAARPDATPAGSGARLKPRPPTEPPETAQLSNASLDMVLSGLAGGATARAALLLALGGREFTVSGLIDTIERTPPWRANPALRDGRTVLAMHDSTGRMIELRLPPSRNAEIDALTRGELITTRAVLKAWDEVAARAVLEAVEG